MSLSSIVTGLLAFFLGSIPGLLISGLMVLTFVWYTSRPKNIPPGPLGVPLLGYLPFIKEQEWPDQCMELSKKYGSIFSAYFANRLVVILNGYEANKKALVEHGEVFSGRAQDTVEHIDPIAAKNLIFGDGLIWRENRRFTLSKFRDFGMGRSSIEPAILNELGFFLDEVAKMKNKDFNFRDLLALSICNNVVILELGERLEYTDPNFLQLNHALEKLMDSGNGFVEFFFPVVEKIPILNRFFYFEQMRNSHQVFNSRMKKYVELHRKEYKEGSDNDYINAYFTEKKAREKNNNHAELFDDEALIGNLKMLFMAGMETTTTTLRWAILYLITHPDVQRKVQKEMDDVIGNQRTPSMEDRLRMPYTEAVILEVQRISCLIPFALPHRTTADVTVDGVFIPADTIIFPNLWSVHFDEKLFPDPHSFRPERFLNEEGKVNKTLTEWVIPFSLGKRFCLGEPLARMELFLYFTAIFQRFTLTLPQSGATVSVKGHMSFNVNGPLPFEAHVLVRNINY